MMYCTNCGAERTNDAPFCPSCNARIRKFATPPAIPNYLVQSILVTFCCCQIAGPIALFYAAGVNTKVVQGDIAGAQRNSKLAKTWCWVGFGIGLAAAIIYASVVAFSIANAN
jgi:hypothetical protein